MAYPDRIDIVDVPTLKPSKTIRPDLDPLGVAFGAGDSLVVWSAEELAFFDATSGTQR